MSSRVLLATCTELPDGDEDASVLDEALRRAGVEARWVAWTDPHVDWDEATVVVRSVWDYQWQRDRLLAWAGSLPRVANSADVIGWNTDKTYLHDLAGAGVPIVPTTVVAPGRRAEYPQAAEFVVKPSVGAGSRGAGRFSGEQVTDADAHVAALHAAGRTALVQPYLDSVDSVGETALVYFAGVFSHAIRKGGMLPPATVHPVDGHELFVAERISGCRAQDDELEVGAQALEFARSRFGTAPLYARVDLLRAPDGPVVTELEVTDPSLFLSHDADAGDRFAAAIAELVA